jgi:hypothetical protein
MTMHIGVPEEKSIVNARRGRKDRLVCGMPAGCPGLIARFSIEPGWNSEEEVIGLSHPHGYRVEKETGYYAVVGAERDANGRYARKFHTTRRPIDPERFSLDSIISPVVGYFHAMTRLILYREPSSARRGVFGHDPVLPCIIRCIVCGHPNRVTEELLNAR